jgi:hypothetical protein
VRWKHEPPARIPSTMPPTEHGCLTPFPFWPSLQPVWTLTGIWAATGVWVGIRALFEMLRIWPGTGERPLNRRRGFPLPFRDGSGYNDAEAQAMPREDVR